MGGGKVEFRTTEIRKYSVAEKWSCGSGPSIALYSHSTSGAALIQSSRFHRMQVCVPQKLMLLAGILSLREARAGECMVGRRPPLESSTHTGSNLNHASLATCNLPHSWPGHSDFGFFCLVSFSPLVPCPSAPFYPTLPSTSVLRTCHPTRRPCAPGMARIKPSLIPYPPTPKNPTP